MIVHDSYMIILRSYLDHMHGIWSHGLNYKTFNAHHRVNEFHRHQVSPLCTVA